MPANNQTEYTREWRKTPSGKEAMAKARRKASIRDRAMRTLAQRYPEEFQKLIDRYTELEDAFDV
jgi:hypothetical protein